MKICILTLTKKNFLNLKCSILKNNNKKILKIKNKYLKILKSI